MSVKQGQAVQRSETGKESDRETYKCTFRLTYNLESKLNTEDRQAQNTTI
mgnify:CR=1 FL=1